MLRRTPLNEIHRAAGARMVEFGGWDMPVQYSGVLAEHRTVRTKAGMFDLSHMGELLVSGPDALHALQTVTTNDLSTLGAGQAQYTMLCVPSGGILDDILVYRVAEGYLLVVNAANTEKDIAWLQEHLKGEVRLEDRSEQTALIALQGPLAEQILQSVTSASLSELYSFEWMNGSVASVPSIISRTGYTGEDGFELYFPADEAAGVWEALMSVGTPLGMVPVGLGARDTLRLEARLTLYGNDIDEETTPLEAGLGFFVKLDKPDFIGREALLAQKEAGVSRRLVAFVVEGRGIPRHGYSICDEQGTPIGTVTSGSFSPTMEKDIGMGYVETSLAKAGSRIFIDVRGKARPAEIIKGRFVQGHTRRRPS
ncbi:MAG: glycine cleavage system aminomethyltransferase GcvT [Limnochordia bacterium]